MLMRHACRREGDSGGEPVGSLNRSKSPRVPPERECRHVLPAAPVENRTVCMHVCITAFGRLCRKNNLRPSLAGRRINGVRMQYRCEAATVEGFVQQVAVSYLARGYWFYVVGRIPEHKDAAAVDAKLLARYGVALSRKERARRKGAGFANLQYIRHGRFFVILATHGTHPFFESESEQFQDARRVPIKFAGYAMSFRNGRVSVRIEVGEYRRLKAYFVDLACRRSVEALAGEFAGVRFQPFAPVRVQLLNIWRAVNRERRAAGYEPVPIEAVPWKRRIVRPFGDGPAVGGHEAA